MFLPDTSIKRPVLTLVVSLSILLAGWLGYRALAVRELPNVEYPIVSVSTALPGASPTVVETNVTKPLEEQINTIEGLKTLTSISGEGASQITAQFELSRDVDLALQDVRAKVGLVRGQLPEDAQEPVVQKVDPNAQPIIWLSIQNPNLDITQVNDFANDVIKQRLQRISGVGNIILGGEQRFAVRIRLDPHELAARHLTVDDVQRALLAENVNLPSGRVEGKSREFTVRTQGRFPTADAFNDLIVATRDGTPIRIGDVGVAEAGVQDERTLARFNGKPTVGVGVVKQSDANTVEVADRVLQDVDRIRQQAPPGYDIEVAVNNADFIKDSLSEVRFTLLVAFGLVVLVILLFLRSWRATFIPALAIPVSIVGTFAVFYVLNFSINTLTLLALVLAIGIVVDDAIVVVENIYRHMEEGEPPFEAARKGSAEIAFAVIAIAITLVIVFLPIALISGIVGRLFREFGLGVAISVLISAFIALTLSPMLSSRILKLEEQRNWVFEHMERLLDRVTEVYRVTLEWALEHRWTMVGIAAGSLLASFFVMGVMGKEFVPQEDRGQFIVTFEAPQGATLEYTDHYLHRIEDMTASTEGVDRFFAAIGLSIGGPPSVNSGLLFIRLKDQRDRSQQQIMNELRGKLSTLAGVDAYAIALSGLQTGAFGKPLQFVIQYPDLDTLGMYADSMVARASRIPGLQGVDSDLDLNKPQLQVTVDRSKASELGVSVAEISNTLQILLGGRHIGDFERGDNRYWVVAQLQDRFRANPEDLRSIYVRSRSGGLVQLGNLVDVRAGVGPNVVSHYNRERSATIGANVSGTSLGAGLGRVRALADSLLPAGFSTDVAGQAQSFQESFASLIFALAMAVVAIYLVLAAQFESFVHPFTIMLALPLALIGAVVALYAFGMTLNIYSMIGIIMLMGLVTKNSILLVDYANQMRERGEERRDAVMRAGTVRLRPILMTSVAIIFGVLPIALALGAGAESRRPLGVAVVAGMFSSTALTLLVVPVFYEIIDDGLLWTEARYRDVKRRVFGGGGGGGGEPAPPTP
ncbi:MAG TPA: efflux RND transporter permease subunit [Gemmatimonadota bacterium]|nr:efflux RND transporter permease subunit [Gemmatimonadota bacterium]